MRGGGGKDFDERRHACLVRRSTHACIVVRDTPLRLLCERLVNQPRLQRGISGEVVFTRYNEKGLCWEKVMMRRVSRFRLKDRGLNDTQKKRPATGQGSVGKHSAAMFLKVFVDAGCGQLRDG